MTVLAIDTATRTIGMGLARPDEILYEKSWHSDNFHTVELAPAVQTALQQSGTSVKDLQSIVLANGPGSYTGLRIGLSFAKGLAFQRGIPIIPINTLDILAAAHPLDDRTLIAIIQAGRSRLIAAHYKVQNEAWTQSGEAYIATLEELYESINEASILCGELSAEERRRLARKHKKVQLALPSQSVRRPAILAELALALPEAEATQRRLGLTPDYFKSEAALPS